MIPDMEIRGWSVESGMSVARPAVTRVDGNENISKTCCIAIGSQFKAWSGRLRDVYVVQ